MVAIKPHMQTFLDTILKLHKLGYGNIWGIPF